ncbi:MAG: S41 family peptidase [Anaerolineaceae bacterium]|nr:S41 family peptidase [Anaerolineaceae bacterium]
MRIKPFSFIALTVILVITSAACQAFTSATPTSTPVPPTATPAYTPTPLASEIPGGTVEISGTFTYTNTIIVNTYYVENAVALADMHGFVIRDKNWVTPVNSQTLGYMNIDEKNLNGSFHLDLPAVPEGTYNNVSNDGKTTTKGVQIYSVAWWPNLAGGPFAEGDDPNFGWPDYLASILTDPANNDEVVSGKLVVWAPDNNQMFPTGFGADGLLFTKDDPVGPIPAGWSVVDLNQKPFGISRMAQENLTLYEPKDYSVKDFSNLSYSAAFDQMYQIVKAQYAFNGIPGKAPNWAQLYAQVDPEVKAAEQKNDPTAYYTALKDFTLGFKDGHTGLSGDAGNQLFQQTGVSGYGLAIQQTDAGTFIVTYVTANSQASTDGIKVGAQVTQFNGTAIATAVSMVKPFSGPFSTDTALLYQQARYLMRAPVGTVAKITYQNPGSAAQTVSLTAFQDPDSFNATSLFRGYDQNALPVESQILSDGVGYIKITSNEDDLNLIMRLFKRALQIFSDSQVPGIIIDMRQDLGGAPLGLAGYLTNTQIIEGQTQYFDPATGKFEPEGIPDKVMPFVEQYKFNKVALLVGQACYSACEIDAYGFSKLPGISVVGQTSTSGTEADVARGQFSMPAGITMQFPTGRIVLPDGSLFLEGTGVPPTVKVPIDVQSLTSGQDVVLQKAESIILGQ